MVWTCPNWPNGSMKSCQCGHGMKLMIHDLKPLIHWNSGYQWDPLARDDACGLRKKTWFQSIMIGWDVHRALRFNRKIIFSWGVLVICMVDLSCFHVTIVRPSIVSHHQRCRLLRHIRFERSLDISRLRKWHTKPPDRWALCPVVKGFTWQDTLGDSKSSNK